MVHNNKEKYELNVIINVYLESCNF